MSALEKLCRITAARFLLGLANLLLAPAEADPEAERCLELVQ